MKWSILVGLLVLCLVRNIEGGALRCSSANDGPSCSTDREENVPGPPVVESERGVETECLAGSEWESNCHYCRCSDSGVAECLKQSSCDIDVLVEPIQCKPNTTFVRDCNTCMCLENGLGLCTLDICAKSTIPKKSELISGKECAPGSTWKSQCRQCECDEQGYAVCTDIPCEGKDTESIMRCAPSTVWKNDCNTCWCTTLGQPVCTRMGCVTAPNFETDPITSPTGMDVSIAKSLEDNQIMVSKPHSVTKRSVCKPSQEFESDCNSCKCASDGQSYTCTHNECLDREKDTNKDVEVFMESEGVDHIERHSVCKPRDIFYIGCNTCNCNAYGTDYSCTNKPCPLPEDVEVFHELKKTKTSSKNPTKIVCVANRMFIKECNTCWCNEDGTGYFCTRRVCVPEEPDEVPIEDVKPENLRIIKRECRPDEVFELDCNMCRCNPDGKGFSCTRRACFDSEDIKNMSLSRKVRASQEEPAKACQPGQEFRLDCNKCLCDNEGQNFSCTRIDCAALNKFLLGPPIGSPRTKRETTEQISTRCEPDSVFNRECNVCRCTKDGNFATCTLKTCHDNSLEAQHTTDAESSSGFRCNAGEQFKQGCNDCTCSADGKSIFCTLRYCDENITLDI